MDTNAALLEYLADHGYKEGCLRRRIETLMGDYKAAQARGINKNHILRRAAEALRAQADTLDSARLGAWE